MHFVRVPRTAVSDAAINMTDFSRKNSLPEVSTEPSFRSLVDALSNLHSFGRSFYNETTVSVLKAAVDFMVDFADEGEPDCATTKRLALWINMKLGQFRGLLISDGLNAAAQVQNDFTLRDSLLAALLNDLQKEKVDALKAFVDSKLTASPSPARYPGKAKSTSKVPKSVSRTLPKQGSMELCLRYLSKNGCTEREPGKCYSRFRAHFRPTALSKEAKDHISTHFGGLAPEFADL